MKIKLIRMGADFYDGEETGDMDNYRLRPTLDDATNCKLPLKGGGYIAGDFLFWWKNKTNNTKHDALHWSFTEYGTPFAEKHMGSAAYHGLDKFYTDDHAKRLTPTLANIRMLLSEAIGEDIELELEERK